MEFMDGGETNGNGGCHVMAALAGNMAEARTACCDAAIQVNSLMDSKNKS